MNPYSLYDDDGNVIQDGTYNNLDDVQRMAVAMGGLNVYLGLTTTKYIDPVTKQEAVKPNG